MSEPHITVTKVWKRRHLGGYAYQKCKGCGTEMEVKRPIELDAPYCGGCGKVVLDATQTYCCWCGGKFEDSDTDA